MTLRGSSVQCIKISSVDKDVLMNTCGTHINTLYAPPVRQYVHACVPYSLEHPNRIGCRAIMQSGIRCVWLFLIVIMRRTIAMLSMLPVNHNEDYTS